MHTNFNADCMSEQTNWALSLPFVAGTFVWTLTDYFGEPNSWPHIRWVCWRLDALWLGCVYEQTRELSWGASL